MLSSISDAGTLTLITRPPTRKWRSTRARCGDKFPNSIFPDAVGYVAVSDNSEGMSLETIQSGWLIVSNSAKRRMKATGIQSESVGDGASVGQICRTSRMTVTAPPTVLLMRGTITRERINCRRAAGFSFVAWAATQAKILTHRQAAE